MSSYLDYMSRMSQTDLRGYLGEQLVDLLIEWLPDSDMLLTKQKMISMINSLYGTSIFKDRKFRRDLLQCMKSSEIMELRDSCLTGTEKSETDPMNIINIVVNKPWNKNAVTAYLLKLWGISDSIFDKKKDDTVIQNVVDASEEQFYELLDYQYYIKQRVLNNLNSGHLLERMLVHMPTGTGKTKTSMHVITNYINFTLEKKGINERDYIDFDQKSAYLAAKLMTIFMEYPIIFMGYSISDVNIQKIIKSLIGCLDMQQIKTLEDRFVFVEYQPGKVGIEVSPYTIMVDDKPLSTKRVVVEDFKLIYKALEGKKSKLPVRILRRFKQELYDFTVTNMPTSSMRVASIEDDRIQDEELVMAIGRYSDYGLRGLHGLKADEWYRNIVVGDIEFSADDLLQYAYEDLTKQNSGRLPVNKYLTEAVGNYPNCAELAKKQNFDYIISATIKKNRNRVGNYKSVKQIWENEKNSLERSTGLIAYLTEQNIDVDELEGVLKEIFETDINILQNSKPAIRTNVRRLIMIYDYLKWGK